MSTLTVTEHQAIESMVMDHDLCSGFGDEDTMCSIVAINLALTGTLTDTVPDCMSLVIGKWIIKIQDAMPDRIRNSHRWKSALVRAAGTGRDNEQEYLSTILNWMWAIVLPILQPLADSRGFGPQWQTMLVDKSADAANAAYYAATKSANAAAYTANAAYYATKSAKSANAADYAANAAYYAANAAANAANAADYAADAANAANAADAWLTFDPSELLTQLVS